MTTILAHRGNISGPSASTENRLPTIQTALARGWGLEIDVRRASDGRFYISHDPQPSADPYPADAVFDAIRAYPHATVALNVKELGDEAALLRYLDSRGVLPQAFLFDMELIETIPGRTAQLFRQLDSDVRLAARVSDRNEPLEQALAIEPASVVWLDEFDRQWCTEQDVYRLKAAGRLVYAVSPDLHQFPMECVRWRWIDFVRWGVDGICTDYPADLERLVPGVAA